MISTTNIRLSHPVANKQRNKGKQHIKILKTFFVNTIKDGKWKISIEPNLLSPLLRWVVFNSTVKLWLISYKYSEILLILYKQDSIQYILVAMRYTFWMIWCLYYLTRSYNFFTNHLLVSISIFPGKLLVVHIFTYIILLFSLFIFHQFVWNK